jgi:hypothetical protein
MGTPASSVSLTTPRFLFGQIAQRDKDHGLTPMPRTARQGPQAEAYATSRGFGPTPLEAPEGQPITSPQGANNLSSRFIKQGRCAAPGRTPPASLLTYAI